MSVCWFFTIIKLSASEKGSYSLLQTHISHVLCNLPFELLFWFWYYRNFERHKVSRVLLKSIALSILLLKTYLKISLEHGLSYIFITALLSTCFECSPTT